MLRLVDSGENKSASKAYVKPSDWKMARKSNCSSALLTKVLILYHCQIVCRPVLFIFGRTLSTDYGCESCE